MSAWLKKFGAWVVAAVVAVVGALIFVLTLGRRGGKQNVPARPVLPDVVVPGPVDLNTTPADDYEAGKKKPVDDQQAVVDDINRRYG